MSEHVDHDEGVTVAIEPVGRRVKWLESDVSVAPPPERRAAARLSPGDGAGRAARLMPGQDVVVLNLSAGGALVESPHRMAPGKRTALVLTGHGRRTLGVTVLRCEVRRLEPLRFVAGLAFDGAGPGLVDPPTGAERRGAFDMQIPDSGNPGSACPRC